MFIIVVLVCTSTVALRLMSGRALVKADTSRPPAASIVSVITSIWLAGRQSNDCEKLSQKAFMLSSIGLTIAS